MKGGKPFRVPLSQTLIDFLSPIKRNHEPVFKNPKGLMLSDAAFLTALKRMDWHSRTVVHGLRSTMRTYLGENTNYPVEILEATLSHSVGMRQSEIQRAYNHGPMFERRREVMQVWWDYLEADKVLPLMQR